MEEILPPLEFDVTLRFKIEHKIALEKLCIWLIREKLGVTFDVTHHMYDCGNTVEYWEVHIHNDCWAHNGKRMFSLLNKWLMSD